MRIQQPGIYWNDGLRKKFSDDEPTSFGVEGHCGDQMPSNADKIRTMSNENLAYILGKFCKEMAYCIVCPLYGSGCPMSSNFNDWVKWLQQPIEGE